MLHVNNPKVTVEFALTKFNNIWFRVSPLGVIPRRDGELRTMHQIFWKIPSRHHAVLAPLCLTRLRNNIVQNENPKLTALVNAIKELKGKRDVK